MTPVWIPSGLMLTWALIRGNYIWPGIFLGAFIGNVWAYADFSSASIIINSLFSGTLNGVGDTICTISAAYLFKLAAPDGNPFKSLTSFMWLFIFGVLLGPLISALMGVNGLYLNGFLPDDSYIIVLITWFVGDAVGVLLFTPLTLLYFLPDIKRSHQVRRFELMLFIAILIPIPFLGYYADALEMVNNHPSLLIVPLFFWCALRMNQIFVIGAASYFSIASIIASYYELGLYSLGATSQFQSLLTLQFFIIIIISSVFILSSLVSEKEYALRQLQENYDHDPLTKIFNRQYLDRQLDEEINRQKRYGYKFCLIMYDIDLFKKVNDTYGHLVGDKVLIELSKLVTREIRDIDTLARWGGEEFMILMPQTDIRGAEIIAERIRTQVETSSIFPEDKLTVSIGIIEINQHEERESQIKRLDEALYCAKNNGRNQVVCAS